jgi:hypothetical protein
LLRLGVLQGVQELRGLQDLRLPGRLLLEQVDWGRKMKHMNKLRFAAMAAIGILPVAAWAQDAQENQTGGQGGSGEAHCPL